MNLELKSTNCNHKYEYIATERTPTDQYNYGMREYKEEVIVYCPLCHTHTRMTIEEWEQYHGLAASINRFTKGKEIPICTFTNKEIKLTFDNAIFNQDWLNEIQQKFETV